MTIDEIYKLDGRVETFVKWVKDRYKNNRNRWEAIRPFMSTHVGWNRLEKPTKETLPLFTAEAYDTVLREIYPYID